MFCAIKILVWNPVKDSWHIRVALRVEVEKDWILGSSPFSESHPFGCCHVTGMANLTSNLGYCSRKSGVVGNNFTQSPSAQ
jgi:hypothetical protein